MLSIFKWFGKKETQATPQRGYFSFNGGGAAWLSQDRESYMNQFHDCIEVNSMIESQIAIPVAQMEFELIDSKTKEPLPEWNIFQKDFQKLIKNPNKKENKQDFLHRIVIYLNTQGNCLIYRKKDELIIFPFEFVDVIVKDQTFQKIPFHENEIVGYTIKENGTYWTYTDVENFIHIKLATTEFKNGSFLFGTAPFKSLNKVITSFLAGTEYRTSMEQHDGALNIISGVENGFPLTDEETQKISESFNDRFGIGYMKNGLKKLKNMVTNKAVKVQAVSGSIASSQTLEIKKSNEKDLALKYRISLSSIDNSHSTYNNLETASKENLLNCYIPLAKIIANGLTNGLHLDQYGYEIVPILRNFKQLQENIEVNDKIYGAAWDRGTATKNEHRKSILLEELPDGNVFKTIGNEIQKSK